MAELTWNPRYVAYARAHNHTPQEQRAADYKAWPGGVMTGFQLWIIEQKAAFFKAHPEAFHVGWNGKPDAHRITDFAAWDQWLDNAAQPQTKGGTT